MKIYESIYGLYDDSYAGGSDILTWGTQSAFKRWFRDKYGDYVADKFYFDDVALVDDLTSRTVIDDFLCRDYTFDEAAKIILGFLNKQKANKKANKI